MECCQILAHNESGTEGTYIIKKILFEGGYYYIGVRLGGDSLCADFICM